MKRFMIPILMVLLLMEYDIITDKCTQSNSIEKFNNLLENGSYDKFILETESLRCQKNADSFSFMVGKSEDQIKLLEYTLYQDCKVIEHYKIK